MQGLKHIAQIRAYLDYVEQHLLNVQKCWKILQEKCRYMNLISDDHLWAHLDSDVQAHDVSKFSKEEFIPYVHKFYPVEGLDPKTVKDEFTLASFCHVARNRHHWEHWTRSSERFPNEHACDCMMMVCDWMAMGMAKGDTAEQYYLARKDQIGLPAWAHDLCLEIFECLKVEEMPITGSEWMPIHSANPRYPRNAVTVIQSSEAGRVQYAHQGYCEVYSATPETFFKSYRPVTAEDRAAPPEIEVAYFGFDEGPTIMAFTDGTRWNGWGKPLATLDAIQRWLEKSDVCEEPDNSYLKVVDGKLIHHDPQYAEDNLPVDQILEPVTVKFRGQEFQVYDISLGWIWGQFGVEDLDLKADEDLWIRDAIIPQGLESYHADLLKSIERKSDE